MINIFKMNMLQMENKPTSLLLHVGAAIAGITGAIAGAWWLNKNPLELNSNMILGLLIVYIFIISVMLNLGSIAHAHLEKNYNYDPMAGLVFG